MLMMYFEMNHWMFQRRCQHQAGWKRAMNLMAFQYFRKWLHLEVQVASYWWRRGLFRQYFWEWRNRERACGRIWTCLVDVNDICLLSLNLDEAYYSIIPTCSSGWILLHIYINVWDFLTFRMIYVLETGWTWKASPCSVYVSWMPYSWWYFHHTVMQWLTIQWMYMMMRMSLNENLNCYFDNLSNWAGLW